MTPQERQLVDELFDKLARLEGTPRDRDAERAMADGLARAPNAVYPLVQTVLVQDEALKRADARIRELSGEDEAPREGGGFLDSMRNALTGGSTRGSVPSVAPAPSSGPDPRWNTGGAYAQAPAQGAPYQGGPAQGAPAQPIGSGGSFLGTAAASAAGVVGGALLMNSISSMFGHHGGGFGGGSAFGGDTSASPWSSGASNSDLARDAGLNDVGGGSGGGSDRSAGLFDADDTDTDVDVADSGDFGGDDDGNTA
jgi:hypothetical protein